LRSAGEVVSSIAWKIRPQEAIAEQGLRVAGGKYLETEDGSKKRLIALFRVKPPVSSGGSEIDYAGAIRAALQQQRLKGLFEGLRKASVPFLYTVLLNQFERDSEKAQIFEFDLVVGTWADGGKDDAEETAQAVEQRASVLSATLGVALADAAVARLLRDDLAGFVKALLLPGRRSLSQAGPPGAAATICSFDEVSPASGELERLPEFYVPNSAESGNGGIILGSLRSGGGEFHDFRLQLDDLRRHICVLGMTGSGKSTTAAAVVKQVAAEGLPTMVLDWHNEYGKVVASVGGKVVAPGKDEFSVNPLAIGPGADPVEHIATVADIFSDIYHFTHPQAYMFRNALQRRMSESSPEEVPDILSLVRTIEAYPLRSAYDNETKVALLRRLVPLTQGQSGKALGSQGPVRFEELLRTVVCLELGHMRDVQARAVFADVMLKMVYEEKVRRRGTLDHLTVVEEARNLAPARRPEDPPSVGERMISELRKFGEAMMFVAQFPSHVASEVVKNSGTKIVHRLAWPDDVGLIGDSLGLTRGQREHMTRLRVGEAIVGVSRIQEPFLVQVRPEYGSYSETRPLNLGPEA
jgi:DNA helicase HerA-like ATPase